MNAVSPLKQSCEAVGYDYNKLPEGASDVKKNNDGTFTITVNGQPVKYKADGSVFAATTETTTETKTTKTTTTTTTTNTTTQNSPETSKSPANTGGAATGATNGAASGNAGGNTSIFGSGYGGSNGVDLTQSYMNLGYRIDPNLFMMSSMNFDATTQMASSLPFGLGTVFGQGAVQQSLQNFLNSVQFKFDFTNLREQVQQQPFGFFAPPQVQPVVSQPSQTVTNEDGTTTTVAQLAKDAGYAATNINGIYIKDEKYYKYDAETKKFVQCNADGTSRTKVQVETEERAIKKETVKKDVAPLVEDLFDAMKGIGTKDEKLQKTINKITADNVIEVFEAWNSSYSDAMDGENFIESLQGEYHSGLFNNKQINLEKQIVNALYKRAVSIGLVEEATSCRGIVNTEHNSTFGSSDEVVRNAIMKLVEQIRAKEAGVEYTPTPKTT